MSARQFCTKRVTIQRRIKTGKASFEGHSEWLTDVTMTPLWANSNDQIVDQLGHDPTEVKECYHVPLPGQPLPDIKRGDRIVYPDVGPYDISFAEEWEDEAGGDIGSLRLIVHVKEIE